jgi:predicted nucleotidyltransferase
MTLRRRDQPEREAILRALVARLQAEPRVAYAHLHGSFVDRPVFHDVDVAIHVAGDSRFAGHLALDLSTRLTEELGVAVDVRAVNDAPLSFRFRALRGRLLVSHDDERLAAAIEETTQRYLDIEPLLRIATREAFAA